MPTSSMQLFYAANCCAQTLYIGAASKKIIFLAQKWEKEMLKLYYPRRRRTEEKEETFPVTQEEEELVPKQMNKDFFSPFLERPL